MDNPIRIGIAGTGFAGRFHLENIDDTGAQIVGATSVRAESRDAFAARYGIRSFASVTEMLPEIDVLDICTPPSSHSEYILQAAAAGKHIIVEKPFTGFYGSPERYDKRQMLDEVVREAQRLRDAVRGAGIIFGYAEK